MKVWESIFTQSPVNRGYYDEDTLPHVRWQWPHTTWFQARREYLRHHQIVRGDNVARKSEA
jgi:hypothetical protein